MKKCSALYDLGLMPFECGSAQEFLFVIALLAFAVIAVGFAVDRVLRRLGRPRSRS